MAIKVNGGGFDKEIWWFFSFADKEKDHKYVKEQYLEWSEHKLVIREKVDTGCNRGYSGKYDRDTGEKVDIEENFIFF